MTMVFAITNDTIQSVAFALECVGGVLVVVGGGIALWKWNQKRLAGGATTPRASGARSSVGTAGLGRTKLPELPATFLPEPEPPANSAAAPPPLPASPAKTEWMYFVDGQQHGPVSSQELRQLAAAGKLSPTDLVWREGLADWAPAAKLKGLFSAGGKNS